MNILVCYNRKTTFQRNLRFPVSSIKCEHTQIGLMQTESSNGLENLQIDGSEYHNLNYII